MPENNKERIDFLEISQEENLIESVKSCFQDRFHLDTIDIDEIENNYFYDPGYGFLTDKEIISHSTERYEEEVINSSDHERLIKKSGKNTGDTDYAEDKEDK